IARAYMRSSRAPTAWKVPDHGIELRRTPAPSPRAAATMRSTLLCISLAARREKVSSRMRLGSAPCTMRCATRWASVLVFPEPAPAMTKSGPAMFGPGPATPCSTAKRCSALRPLRYGATNMGQDQEGSACPDHDSFTPAKTPCSSTMRISRVASIAQALPQPPLVRDRAQGRPGQRPLPGVGARVKARGDDRVGGRRFHQHLAGCRIVGRLRAGIAVEALIIVLRNGDIPGLRDLHPDVFAV